MDLAQVSGTGKELADLHLPPLFTKEGTVDVLEKLLSPRCKKPLSG